MKRNNKNGFTLVEVIVVIVIISLISTFVFTRIANIDVKSKEKLYEGRVETVLAASKKYGSDNIDMLNSKCTVVTVNDLLSQGYITEDIESDGDFLNPLDNSSMKDTEICVSYNRGKVSTKLKEDDDETETGKYKVTVYTSNGYAKRSVRYVYDGEDAVFDMISDLGYNFQNPVVACSPNAEYNVETVSGKELLTITNVKSNITCSIDGKKNVYSISVEVENGTPNPNTMSALYDEDGESTITPNEGYTLNNATYSCNNNLIYGLDGNKLKVYNVKNGGECSVSPNLIYYNVAAEVVNGNIVGDSNKTIGHGESNTFNYTVNEGYNMNGVNPSCNFNASASVNEGVLTVSNVKGAGKCTITPKGNTYTVNYNGNGNTGGSTSSSTHTYGTPKALTANGFTKNEYEFIGWNTKDDGTGTSYSDQESVSTLTSTDNGSVTLYAQWKRNTYTVTFDKNYLANDIYGSKPISVNSYDYYSTSPSSKTFTEDLSVKNGTVIELTMNYGSTGGVYYSPEARLEAGKTYTWSVYLKASSNKTLNIGSEQSGQKIVNVTTAWQRFTHTFTAEDTTYYAFTFYLSNSTWSSGNKLYIHSLEIEETDSLNVTSSKKIYNTQLGTLETPSREGYTFDGWYTAPVGGTQISSSTIMPENDVTYYAHYTANKYYLDLNGVLGGTNANDISGYGTVDVYINGIKEKNDVSDFWIDYPYGTNYEINDIKASSGHSYVGVSSGQLTGRILGETNVVLEYKSTSSSSSGSGSGSSGGSSSCTPTYSCPSGYAYQSTYHTCYYVDDSCRRVLSAPDGITCTCGTLQNNHCVVYRDADYGC